jgi:hypothetical protein
MAGVNSFDPDFRQRTDFMVDQNRSMFIIPVRSGFLRDPEV